MTGVDNVDARFQAVSRAIAASKAAVQTLQGRADDARDRVTADDALVTQGQDRIGGLEDLVDLDRHDRGTAR